MAHYTIRDDEYGEELGDKEGVPIRFDTETAAHEFINANPNAIGNREVTVVRNMHWARIVSGGTVEVTRIEKRDC
jgi:hypothetical protein